VIPALETSFAGVVMGDTGALASYSDIDVYVSYCRIRPAPPLWFKQLKTT
jgi:hypothetical protein